MRKFLIVTSALAAAALAGTAVAQSTAQTPAPGQHGRGGMLFQSDANQDGVVTRAEFDAGQTASFTRIDANNDGALTREEMRAQRGERGARRGGRHGGMERADANSDGNVTREEFLARPTQMFDRLDANHDGVISASERPQRPQRTAGERRGGWTNPDTNGDGSISRAEYNAAGAARFERIDANRDGRVTREEVSAARPPRPGAN